MPEIRENPNSLTAAALCAVTQNNALTDDTHTSKQLSVHFNYSPQCGMKTATKYQFYAHKMWNNNNSWSKRDSNNNKK